MIDEKYWIELPVEYNLDNNPNVSIPKSYRPRVLVFPQAFVVVSDPNLEIYDYVVSQLTLLLTFFFPAIYMIATDISL